MEFSSTEAQAIEALMLEALQHQEKQVGDMVLAFAGGGSVIVTCG